jgi:2-polyprenyl-6-methoxyphenol hydroxylase-like FAD-dependent oxidoreductase
MTTRNTGGHALVVGGSIAGLFVARVLAEYFERVTLIERDSFTESPEFRKGVPQSRHLHVFMPRGRGIAERLFPRLEEALVSSGAELMDMGEGGAWLTPAGLAPRFYCGVSLITCTRNLIEHHIRQRVAALENVRFLERTDVTRLLPGPGESVAGVEIRLRDGQNSRAPEEPLLADLVVDASGRNSRTPRWLQELGYAPPEETVINAHPGYATRLFERPEDIAEGRRIIFVQTAPPEHDRGGVMIQVEGGRWLCSLLGMGGDHPPTDEEGYMAFARSLRSPMLYEAIKDAPPASPIHGYREIENKWRHYEKLPRQPDNLLVVGDAACAFNPIYGQGMTTAALGAETLEGCLRSSPNAGFTGLSRRFQKKLAKVNSAPWLLATSEDLRVHNTEGGKAGFSTRLTHRYMDRVLELSLRDLEVRRTFLEVYGMLAPPSALFGPTVAAKLLREGLTRRRSAGGRAVPGQWRAFQKFLGRVRRHVLARGRG